ncbi:uncharacterized protein LOC126687531 [Mercurialis annua]|uniref:uncharacterized protein LOC126687531 n=1 Tax=Mercurialis annua TaxID=3986 RepID=UPI00215E53C5|nr:uncharacterized protein LOC126687531 [Mercurialis annua]
MRVKLNLWLLPIYPRIKNFMWRALHGALPIGEQLITRCNITINCIHCGGVESMVHMLFLCPFSQRIWFASPLGLRKLNFPSLPFHLLWRYLTTALISQDPSKKLLNLCCFVCWFIWKSRNKLQFEHEQQCALKVMHAAVAAYSEYAGINPDSLSSYSVNNNIIVQDAWVAPPPGFIKLNYDASTSRVHHCGFVAAIARDSNGLVIGRFHAYFRHIWDPGILELLALRESLNWAVLCSWNNVIMEGDALQVSQVINSHNIVDYRTWGICQDVWRLKQRFVNCLVQYGSRKFNGLAHDLASVVKSFYIQAL